jgi:NADPH-dependent curcumin reductase CurA
MLDLAKATGLGPRHVASSTERCHDCIQGMAMNSINHQIRLAARPSGLPKRSDWELATEPVQVPAPGELLVAVSHLSIDPAMRRWIDTDFLAGDPVPIGAVMEAGALGRVTASEHPGFAVGEHVYGAFGVQEFGRSDGTGVTKLDPLLAPLPTYLGALGTTGLTAYFGLLDVGRARAGDSIVVSGAAGAVGSVAGQIAKIKGCRAIGIAGGPEKCRWIVEDLGFDNAIDYKDQDVSRALRDSAPDGVGVFFDNVGGEILDAVLTRLARGARIVLSGSVSQYNAQEIRGPSNYLQLIAARASMTGMLTPDYADRYPEARAELARWLDDGRLISHQDIREGGVGAFPDVLPTLFAGENRGKLVLAVP